jgi:hypothetical protein
MPDPKLPPPIYGARGEEFQAMQEAEDEVQRSPWLFRWCLVGVAVIVGGLWWL